MQITATPQQFLEAQLDSSSQCYVMWHYACVYVYFTFSSSIIYDCSWGTFNIHVCFNWHQGQEYGGRL